MVAPLPYKMRINFEYIAYDGMSTQFRRNERRFGYSDCLVNLALGGKPEMKPLTSLRWSIELCQGLLVALLLLVQVTAGSGGQTT